VKRFTRIILAGELGVKSGDEHGRGVGALPEAEPRPGRDRGFSGITEGLRGQKGDRRDAWGAAEKLRKGSLDKRAAASHSARAWGNPHA